MDSAGRFTAAVGHRCRRAPPGPTRNTAPRRRRCPRLVPRHWAQPDQAQPSVSPRLPGGPVRACRGCGIQPRSLGRAGPGAAAGRPVLAMREEGKRKAGRDTTTDRERQSLRQRVRDRGRQRDRETERERERRWSAQRWGKDAKERAFRLSARYRTWID
jgi:hypothetical protein